MTLLERIEKGFNCAYVDDSDGLKTTYEFREKPDEQNDEILITVSSANNMMGCSVVETNRRGIACLLANIIRCGNVTIDGTKYTVDVREIEE